MVGSTTYPPTSLKQLVVPITLRQRHGKALVDTGATYTLLHVSLWLEGSSSYLPKANESGAQELPGRLLYGVRG